MHELESEQVETPAGTYTIEWLHDDSPEQPYDWGFGMAVIGDRRYIDVVTDAPYADEVASLVRYHRRQNAYDGNIYDHEIRSSAAIARYLRLKYGLKGLVVVDQDSYSASEPSADRGESFDGLAWAPDDASDPDAYTRSALESWAAWAEGDVFGWQALDPQGNEIGSCWGFYGLDREREYTRSEALSTIEHDVAERTARANLVGSGIVGLI